VLVKRLFVLITLLFAINVLADEGKKNFVMNFDFDLSDVSTSRVFGSLQLQGIRLRENNQFQGKDLGKIDYFFTVSETDKGEGKLTVEFYQYESRKKKVALSEVVSEVSFQFGSPATFITENESFRLDLAFSIDRR